MKNHIKTFGRFVNERVNEYYFYGDPDQGEWQQDNRWMNRIVKNFRNELIGGRGQKRDFDQLSDDEQFNVAVKFHHLGKMHPMATHTFISKLSRFSSIAEIEEFLDSLLDEFEDQPRGRDEEPNWDFSM
jgi:hypothetical protein